VLEQPVTVGVVEVLGRRRDAEALPRRAAAAEEAVEQPGQERILDGGLEGAKLRLQALRLLLVVAFPHPHAAQDRPAIGRDQPP
jgi:hypothetical protein